MFSACPSVCLSLSPRLSLTLFNYYIYFSALFLSREHVDGLVKAYSDILKCSHPPLSLALFPSPTLLSSLSVIPLTSDWVYNCEKKNNAIQGGRGRTATLALTEMDTFNSNFVTPHSSDQLLSRQCEGSMNGEKSRERWRFLWRTMHNKVHSVRCCSNRSGKVLVDVSSVTERGNINTATRQCRQLVTALPKQVRYPVTQYCASHMHKTNSKQCSITLNINTCTSNSNLFLLY